MSRMQIVQQKESRAPYEKVKTSLKLGAILLVQTAAVVADFVLGIGFFSITAALVLSLGAAIDLKERKVIVLTAVAFTALITAVSVSVLFPPAAPFMLSLVCFTASVSYLWSLSVIYQQLLPNPK